MRRVGPLIAILILFIIGGVGATYYARLKVQYSSAPAKPKSLPMGTTASAERWSYTQHGGKDGKPVVSIDAQDVQESAGKYALTNVELHLFHKENDEYDQVKSARAEFDINQGVLYSDGDVEITMRVNPDEPPSGRLMVIRSSGVHFESKTGKAYTDRVATFKFDRGEGKALGATYDPNTRELFLKSEVELIWTGTDPRSKPMKVQSAEVTYKERESKVLLSPWTKFVRDTLSMDAGPAVVTLDNGVIKLIETTNAKGCDQRPGRNLEFAADQLTMDFDDGQVKKITGVQRANLISTAETDVTTTTADRVDLDFDTTTNDSVLQTAVSSGHSVVESKPATKPGSDTPETRILKSDVIRTSMRPGGQEIQAMETASAGSIEFVPNGPDQSHRFMNGDHIWITYGPKNQIQTFRSVNVSTRTLTAKAKDAKQPPAPQLTWSKELLATFQPNSSQIEKLEQWNDFRYEEGDRKAKADRAVLDQPNNIITLLTGARVSDATGTADADKIVLNQKSGDFMAEGNVNSTRLPDKQKDSSGGGGMLDEDEPLHAKAKKMSSTDNNLLVRYEGNAVLWQGANRLQADEVEIDRDNSVLKARGNVLSQLLDKAKDDKKDQPAAKPATKTAARVFTIVKAPELVYNDENREATYKGGAILTRPNMQVKAREIRAFLRNNSNDSSLDHAFADGKVEIAQTAPGRIRNGTSEHAEYYLDDDKVILEGGQPQFIDSLKGTTRGAKLTWFSKDDRLLVNGAEAEPAKSSLKRKHTQ